jgi:hypothetical protein
MLIAVTSATLFALKALADVGCAATVLCRSNS